MGLLNADELRTDRGLQIRWQVVAWVLGVVVSVLMTYNATANNMNARVSVLESQMTELQRQLQHVNDKLDRLVDLAGRGRP